MPVYIRPYIHIIIPKKFRQLESDGACVLRVFVDADVLFAGSAATSEYGASLVVLRMAEITLIEAIASQQVIDKAERNLAEKLPAVLPAFRLIIDRCLRIVPNPAVGEIQRYTGLTHPGDLPILVAAIQNGCPWLVSHNTCHFQPGLPAVNVLTPGEFLLTVRDLLSRS